MLCIQHLHSRCPEKANSFPMCLYVEQYGPVGEGTGARLQLSRAGRAVQSSRAAAPGATVHPAQQVPIVLPAHVHGWTKGTETRALPDF